MLEPVEQSETLLEKGKVHVSRSLEHVGKHDSSGLISWFPRFIAHYFTLILRDLTEIDLVLKFNPVDWDTICSRVFSSNCKLYLNLDKIIGIWMFSLNILHTFAYKRLPFVIIVIHAKVHLSTWSCDHIQSFWDRGRFALLSRTSLESCWLETISPDTDTKSPFIIL